MDKADAAHQAGEELKVVLQQLREAQRVLARDWDALPPRDRSAHAREVKAMEKRRDKLVEELELLAFEIE